ncbi:ATP-binding protein [Methylobacterium fujisawaense]
MESLLNDATAATLAETDYFGPDGPVPTRVASGHPKFALVTGENASGKSFLVRALGQRMRDAHPKLEILAVTMSLRSQGGMARAFLFGDEQRESTGRNSIKAVLAGIRACRERQHDHVLILDEPDIGLAESYAGALGAYLAAFVEDMPDRTLGLVVVTHSRPLVRGLLPTAPAAIRVGDDPRPLEQWLREGPLPRGMEEIEALGERAAATMRGINRVRNARSEAKQASGPRP